jgi:hypothetical protein
LGKAFNAKWTTSAPFIQFDLEGFATQAVDTFNAFKDYAEYILTAVTENIPEIIKLAEALPTEADEAKDKASSEIEALSMMEKPKALMAIAFNIKQIAKIPNFVVTSSKTFIDELKEL